MSRSMPLLLSVLTLITACAGAIDEPAGQEEMPQEVEDVLETREQALFSSFVQRDLDRFVFQITGPRGAIVDVCVKEVGTSGCGTTLMFTLGDGAQGFDWIDVGSNHVQHAVRFDPASIGGPTCDTRYEFRFREVFWVFGSPWFMPWAPVQHHDTATSHCPDGGTLRPAGGGYPAACVFGSVNLSGTNGFIYNNNYYYKPINNVPGACPDPRSMWDTANCWMNDFPGVPAGRTGLVIWPTTFAYRAPCNY